MADELTPGGETYADLADRGGGDLNELAKWVEKAPEGIEYDFARRKLAEGKLEQAEAERDAFRALATEVLGHFTHQGHPGEPCRRTGWIRERQIAAWRAALDTPTPTEEGSDV